MKYSCFSPAISIILFFSLISCATKKTCHFPDQALLSVAWFQSSGEYKALSYQAFNIARDRLDEILKEKSHHQKSNGKRIAVVLDVDETILDNSPYQAKNILRCEKYPVGWTEWIKKASATEVPGAVKFLNYAHSKGVELIYLTNRKKSRIQYTIQNFEKLKIPYKKENFYFKNGVSSKIERRKQVNEKYNIVLLIGDNLGDFQDLFEKKTYQERLKKTDRLQDKFGKKFIVLPNPIYGDWENSLYNYQMNKSDKRKSQDRRESLRSFL